MNPLPIAGQPEHDTPPEEPRQVFSTFELTKAMNSLNTSIGATFLASAMTLDLTR